MNVHERSRTVREQSIVREHVTLNEEIRKLSNKQTNKRCSRTVHEQIYKHQTLKRFPPVKSGIRAHVRTCHVHKPSKIILLYLKNHWTDRAQIWYARRDSLAKRFGIDKRGVHPHVRT